MRARMHGFGLGFLLVVATSAPALAQQPATGTSTTPAKTDYPACNREIKTAESEAAHAKYLSGKVDYDEGKYESAITNFKQAYEKDCSKHELLVIISRAHELNHNLPEAIRALEVYLERQPNAADATTHKQRIASMKEKLAEEKKKAAAAASSQNQGGGGAPAAESSGHTIYPWLVVGGGVLTAAIGVVLIATAPSIPPNCHENSDTCERRSPTQTDADYKEDQDQAGRGKNQPVIGAVVTGIGGAMVVGGLIWYFLEPTGQKDSAKTKVSPQVGPGFGGLAFTGRF